MTIPAHTAMNIAVRELPDVDEWATLSMPPNWHQQSGKHKRVIGHKGYDTLRERCQWYYLDESLADALHHSLTTTGTKPQVKVPEQAPILIPDDLPCLDGFAVMAIPFSNEDGLCLFAMRWASTSYGLLFWTHLGTPHTDTTSVSLSQLWQTRPTLNGAEGLPSAEWGLIPPRAGAPRFHVAATVPSLWRWGQRHAAMNDTQVDEWAANFEATEGRSDEVLHVDRTVLEDALQPDGIRLPSVEQLAEKAVEQPILLPPQMLLWWQWMAAMWASINACSETVSSQYPRKETRPLIRLLRNRRNRGQSQRTLSDIRVASLRTINDGTGSGAVIEARHAPIRHLVRGHWRNHWHPKLGVHRTRWIAPHLRGGQPTDQALRGPRQVLVVD